MIMALGSNKTYIEAMKWYKKAAYRGLPISQYVLGLMYANGEALQRTIPKL